MITSGLLAAAAQAVEYPHWPAEYPLNAWDTLTAADVVGPDGLVYPDWSRVGVTGGIPDLALNDPADGTLLTVGGVQYKVFRVANFTHAGIGTALSSAKAWADGTKRAVVYLPAGTYTVGNASGHVIDENGIVIAGAGIGQTILNVANGNSGCVFNIDGNLGGAQSTVAQNAARGANSVVVASLSTFAVGQWVRIKNGTVLSAAKTMRARYSKEEIGIGFDNNTGKHFPRTFLARITAIDTGAKRLTFDRVLPHAYYADEATDIRQWSPVRFSGLQDFTMDFSLNTTSQNGVNLNDVADCWVKGVKLVKPTQWAIAAEGNHRANVEIRDCIFDGTKQALTSGGNAYLGWCNGDIDCLMVNVQANDHRHMGIFQAAMRNVVSGCTFSGTSVQSPQLHGRLPTDNLVENCTITATSIAGIYSDPVHSLEHGPNGPRNVFYNNTINLDGTVNNTGILFLAGALENPIFAYNRINGKDTWSEYWPTVRAWDRVFNAILIGNHLRALSNAPVLGLEDKSCDGWRVTDNTFYGATGQLSTGDGSIAMAHNNRFTSSTSIGTPTPPAASIWQWQVQNAASPRLVIVIDNKVVPENGGTTARIVRVQASTAASLTVSLSDDQGSLSSPASAVIPAGAKYVDVTLSAGALSGDLSATLTASASGLLGDTETVSLIDSASSVNFGSGHYAPAAISGETNWKLARLGRTQANGSASRSGGTWTLQGAGSYLNDPRTPAQNGYHFVQVPISGNGSITARFVSASGHQQVGVMVTDDLAHVTEMISLEPSKRMHSTCSHADYHADIKPYGQSTTGATSSHNGTWLRLTRNGAVFTAETSPDGTTWTKVSSTYRPYSATADITVNELDFYYPSPHAHYKSMAVLDDVMYFGIFVNSGSLTTLATATFDNVSTTGTVVSPSADTTPPTWASGYPQ
ncbi:MAG: hypothetical protein MUF04_06320, partial [Akkermansiaceae bacterium]|nr:hypothetical protein [Akkermansiaceae bacterium]